MRLIIDIPEQMYINAKTGFLCGGEILVNAIKNGIPQETVTEFADKCRECGKFAVPKSVIEDIKAEIENTGILSSVDIKTGETLYEGLCRYSDVLEIIDKHIGKENECDT